MTGPLVSQVLCCFQWIHVYFTFFSIYSFSLPSRWSGFIKLLFRLKTWQQRKSIILFDQFSFLSILLEWANCFVWQHSDRKKWIIFYWYSVRSKITCEVIFCFLPLNFLALICIWSKDTKIAARNTDSL